MDVASKVVVVTGAGSGMGREVTVELLRGGAKVAAVDINEATVRETASLAGAGAAITAYVVNVADRAAVEALAAQVVDWFGAVDGVVNCAGITSPSCASRISTMP